MEQQQCDHCVNCVLRFCKNTHIFSSNIIFENALMASLLFADCFLNHWEDQGKMLAGAQSILGCALPKTAELASIDAQVSLS